MGHVYVWASQVALVVKNHPSLAGYARDVSLIPRRGRSLEEGMATHSSVIAWRIPWTEEPGRLQFMGLQSQTGLKQLSDTATHGDIQLFQHHLLQRLLSFLH